MVAVVAWGQGGPGTLPSIASLAAPLRRAALARRVQVAGLFVYSVTSGPDKDVEGGEGRKGATGWV